MLRVAEAEQQLSSEACICGSVMGSQCAGQAGALFYRLRDGMNVQDEAEEGSE